MTAESLGGFGWCCPALAIWPSVTVTYTKAELEHWICRNSLRQVLSYWRKTVFLLDHVKDINLGSQMHLLRNYNLISIIFISVAPWVPEISIVFLAHWVLRGAEEWRGREHLVLGHKSTQVTTETPTASVWLRSDLVAISKCCFFGK